VSETVEVAGILTAYFYRRNNTSTTNCTCKLFIFLVLGIMANIPPQADEKITQFCFMTRLSNGHPLSLKSVIYLDGLLLPQE
jgi:hypothetical protein